MPDSVTGVGATSGAATQAEARSPATTTSRGQETTSAGAQGGVVPSTQARGGGANRFLGASPVLQLADAMMHPSNGSTDSNPVPYPTTGRLDLNIAYDNYNPVSIAGFSAQRPEIIAAFQFEPAFSDSSPNMGPAGEMIDIQISSRQLRAENITRLLNELRVDPDASRIISNLEARVNESELKADAEIRFLQEMVERLAAARKSLTVKTNVDFIRNDMSSRNSLNSASDPVQNVMVNLLGFTEEGLRSFSDTKILTQMLDDLLNMIRSYSPSLVERVDPRRARDVDPFSILHITDSTAGASNSFDVRSLTSRTSTEIPSILHRSAVENFSTILQPLSTYDDKLKMLLAVLSKELRISAGLSSPAVKAHIDQTFGIPISQIDGSVFEKIIGQPGNSAFSVASGMPNSLARLLRVDAGDVHVLPFESSFIRNQLDPIVPGQRFYVDSIVTGKTKFDTTSFKNFAQTFGTSVQSLSTVIEGTLDVNVVNTESLGLNASSLLDSFLRLMKDSVREMESPPLRPDASFIDSEVSPAAVDSFTPALLLAAADDPILKYMLVLYVLHVGISSSYQPGARKTIFSTLVESSDFNRGSGVSVGVDPLGGVRAAIGRVVTIANANDVNVYGGRSRNDDVTDLIRGQISSGGSSSETVENALQLNGIDVISAAITARLLDQFAKYDYTTYPGDEIFSDDLIFNHLSTVGAGDQSFLLRSIVDFVIQIDRSARNAVGDNSSDTIDYFISGLTRFNKIGAHTIILMVIELFIGFFKAYPICTIGGAEDFGHVSAGNKEFRVIKDRDLISELKDALEYLTPPLGIIAQTRGPSMGLFLDQVSRDRSTRVQAIVDRFSAIEEKYKKEDASIKGIVNFLLAVGNGVRTESQALTRFFDPTGPNRNAISEILVSLDSETKLAALDEAQIALSKNALLEYQSGRTSAEAIAASVSTAAANAAPASPFLDDTIITAPVRSALFSMLASTGFMSPGANNLSILSVGIPAGFMTSLRQRVSTYSAGFDMAELARRQKMQTNVVRVHVHMKDLLLEDVVFKPVSFTFEMGRFVASTDFTAVRPDDNRSISTLIRDAIVTRALTADGSHFKTELGSAAAADASYDSVLTSSEKQEMARNHVISYLLKVYLKLLTGIDLAEDRFYLDNNIADLRVDPESQDMFVKLLTDRVSKFAGRRVTLPELRASNRLVDDLLTRVEDEDIVGVIDPLGKVLEDASKAVNIEISEDLMNFVRTFGPNSILFGAGARQQKITSPKTFERIFMVPVDPDDFEVDRDLTASTGSGRVFMASQLANRLLAPIGPLQQLRDVAKLEISTYQPVRFDPSVRRELGNLSLRQFFVVIEQLPRLPDLSSPRVPGVRTPDYGLPYWADRHGISRPESSANRATTGAEETPPPTRTEAEENAYDSAPPQDQYEEGIDWSGVL